MLTLAMVTLARAQAGVSAEGTGAADFHSAETADARFLQGLSARHLDALVDAYGRQRWTDPNLTDRQRTDLTVAWIRALTGRALASPPAQRAASWRQAAKLAADFQRRAANAPRGLLVAMQLALAQTAQGEAALQATESINQTASARTAVLETHGALRAALTQFERINERIEARLARAYKQGPGSADGWSVAELESLRRNVSLQRAHALRLQALSYPAGSPDRVNSLTRALERLPELTAIEGAESVRGQARIEMLFCLRLLGRLEQAARLLSKWKKDSPPSLRPRLTAEQLNLLLARQQPDQALACARALLGQAADSRTAETDFAILEVLLTVRDHLLTRPASDPAAARGLAEQATQLARQLGQRYGPVWRQRAMARLGQALATTDIQDTTVLRHVAATLAAAGNLEAALLAYDRAAALAREAGNPAAAFDLSLAAATVASQTQGPQRALRRYRQLALRQPLQPQAAEAHLAAVGLAATLVRQSAPGPSRQQATQDYEGLLLEHLQAWPQAPATATARWWLARLRIDAQRWLEAAKLLGQIPPGSAHYQQAVRASLDFYQRGLRQLSAASTPDSAERASLGPSASSHDVKMLARPTRRQLLATAIRQWQAVILGTDNHWPATWTPLQRSVALALARLQLAESAEGPRYAERLLTAALAQNQGGAASNPASANGPPPPNGPADGTWRSQAMALLAVARARAGKLAAAERLLQKLAAAAPLTEETALTMTQALRLRQESDRQRQRTLARFALRILALVATGESKPGDSRRLAELTRDRGVAHELLDQREAALAAYRQWMHDRPKDGDAMEACARLLGKGPDAAPARSTEAKPGSQTVRTNPAQQLADRREAVQLWQQIERRSKPGGPRWRRARQARIVLLEQLGQPEQAQKLKQLTQVLYP